MFRINEIIFAPSGAGKSHLALREPSLYVDGDTIISKATGWPSGTWADQALADWVHSSNYCLLAAATLLPDQIVLFNGKIKTAWVHAVPASILTILPSAERIWARLQARGMKRADGKQAHPKSLDDVKRNVAALREQATGLGPIMDGEAADAFFGMQGSD